MVVVFTLGGNLKISAQTRTHPPKSGTISTTFYHISGLSYNITKKTHPAKKNRAGCS